MDLWDLFLLLFHLIHATTAAFSSLDCPHQPVDVFWGGICYWLNSDDPTTFFGARKRCRLEGGDLAVIPDQAVLGELWAGVITSAWAHINMYDAASYDGMEGLPRDWVSTNVGSTQPDLTMWRSDQPSGYALNYENKGAKDCAVTRANEKELVDKPCMFHLTDIGVILTYPHICSYDPQEPTHVCITEGDCLSDHYQRLYYRYLEGVDASGVGGYGIDIYGTVSVATQIECGVTCHLTPGCESIKWAPALRQCQLLGHLTMTKLLSTDTVWQLWSRYRFYDYSEP